MSALRWTAQAITYYALEHWGVADEAGLKRLVENNPRAFFEKLLTDVEEAGFDRLELCVAPGDWLTAQTAYGSAENFAVALRARGQQVTGSYQIGWHNEAALGDRAVRKRAVAEVRQHAAFLAEVGASLLLSGPPRRGTVEGSVYAEVSERTLGQTAELFGDFGAAAAEYGVLFSVHTEAYSVACRERDVDRLMAATDPMLVNLCPDLGHLTLDGADAAAVLARHYDRVRSLHLKDCSGPRAELPENGAVSHDEMMEQFRPPGDGCVDWESVVATLRGRSFDGFAVAEIDLAPDPIGASRGIREFVESLGDVERAL